MSDPQTEDDPEELSQDSSGPRLSVWAPILLTGVVIGGLVWWIQSDSDTIDRRRATADGPAVTTDVALPVSTTGGGAGPTAEVALAPAPVPPAPAGAALSASPQADSTPADSTPAEPAPPETASAEVAPAAGTQAADATPAAVTEAVPEPTIDVALAPVVETPIVVAAPSAEPPPAADTGSVAPADVSPPAETNAPVAAAPAASDVAPSAPVEAAAAPAGDPAIVSSSTSLPTARVSDVPAPTRVDAGGVESARVTAPPPALETRPPPSPEPIATLATAAPAETAAAVSARSGPPADPVPTVRVSAPAEIADAPPALPVEAGVAVLPVHRMPIVQPSETSDEGDLKTTEVAAGAEAVVKSDEVVPAETVAPVTIDQASAAAPTVSVTGPQPPIGTIDPAAPVMAEASQGTNVGSAPAAPPAEISPGSPNVGDVQSTDTGVIVAETLDPSTLGIIVPPDARDPAASASDAATAADIGTAPAAETDPADDEHGTIVAAEVDPGTPSPSPEEPAGPADAGAPAAAPGEPVVAMALPPPATTAIVAETLDLSALNGPGSAAGAEDGAAAETVAAVSPPPGAESGAGALPMVAAVAAIAPPRPAWQRFATTTVDAAAGRPTVSVIVAGLGQSNLKTRAAIDTLPQAVALAFDPYASGTAALAAAAQAAGHEVLITLPMESAIADADAGPQAMGAGLSPEANADRLSWALDRARGYVGVLTPMDAELTGDEAGMAPIIASLRRQGLMVVTGAPEDATAAFPADLPQAAVDRQIRLPDDTGRYDSEFDAAEAAARDNGHVVLMVEPYPAAIRAVASWLDGLPGKGLALAPVTATATGRQATAGP